jgi:hypothetical protein
LEDFAGKWRACGRPLYVVMMYLNISESDCYNWFEYHFNIR